MRRILTQWRLIRRAAAALAASGLLLCQSTSQAGGPIEVGGPNFGVPGQPFTWNLAALPDGKIQYRVDPGPLSKTPTGVIVIDHAAGVARVQRLFQVWQDVPTSAVAYNNAGDLLPTGSYTGGPVATVSNFVAVFNSCDAGTQSPIVFDADGSIFRGLGLPAAVIGFAGTCKLDASSGRIVTGGAALNGRFQDGASQPQLTSAEFDVAFTHEFGHFSGLDHSQINVNVLSQPFEGCSLDDLAGLPLMFPVLHCQPRSSVALPVLAPDDLAWISRLYPVTGTPPTGKTLTSSVYGTVSGTVFFTDGITQAQGVNVIARLASDPRRVAFSVVSGYLFTGNFGQSVTCTNPANPTRDTCTNLGGSSFGSRDPRLIGTYDIPVLPGTYTVEVESVFRAFIGGSSVGPLRVPIRNPGQDATLPNTITVAAGQTVSGTDIVLQGTPPRFDSFEGARLWLREPLTAWMRKENPAAELMAG